jgi:hypothetical protein
MAYANKTLEHFSLLGPFKGFDFSTLLDRIDFGPVIGSMMIVFLSLYVLYMAYKGGQFILRALRGESLAYASMSHDERLQLVHDHNDHLIEGAWEEYKRGRHRGDGPTYSMTRDYTRSIRREYDEEHGDF